MDHKQLVILTLLTTATVFVAHYFSGWLEAIVVAGNNLGWFGLFLWYFVWLYTAVFLYKKLPKVKL